MVSSNFSAAWGTEGGRGRRWENEVKAIPSLLISNCTYYLQPANKVPAAGWVFSPPHHPQNNLKIFPMGVFVPTQQPPSQRRCIVHPPTTVVAAATTCLLPPPLIIIIYSATQLRGAGDCDDNGDDTPPVSRVFIPTLIIPPSGGEEGRYTGLGILCSKSHTRTLTHTEALSRVVNHDRL